MMREVVYKPIGVIHSPLELPQDVPIQSVPAKGVAGSVEVPQEYVESLKDVEGFLHLILGLSFSFSTNVFSAGYAIYRQEASWSVCYSCTFATKSYWMFVSQKKNRTCCI